MTPLRRYFGQVFPQPKPLQAEYRTGGGPLLVEGGDANPGTVGAAFDYLVRFTLDPGHVPEVAFLGSRTAGLREVVVTAEG